VSSVKNYILIIIISCHFALIVNPMTAYAESVYESIFKEDYKDAMQWFQDHYALINKIIDQTNADEDILISVVFPERIRYSVIRNYFETEALKLLYTKYGSETVDFSIGDLQLKPSFAEKIESYIQQNEELKINYSKLLINKDKPVSIREERVRRLELLPWQIHYICAFYEIVIMKYGLTEKTVLQKILFIASAFNHGFDKGEQAINDHIDIKLFPYGKHYPGKQYAYTDVALDFYKHTLKELKRNSE
jgi:hypothetical protein